MAYVSIDKQNQGAAIQQQQQHDDGGYGTTPAPRAVVGTPFRIERPIGKCTQFARGVLMFINFLFLIAGIAGIIASTMTVSGKFQRYFDFCSFCGSLSVAGIVFFSLLMLVAGLGFVAVWRRQNVLLTLYSFFLALFLFIGIGLGIVIVLINLGHFDSELHDAWNRAVAADPQAMCQLEGAAYCSGWKVWCPANTTNTEDPVNCALNCANSPMANNIQWSSETCNNRLHHEVKAYFVALVCSSFGMAVFALAAIGIACKVRRHYEEYTEITERF